MCLEGLTTCQGIGVLQIPRSYVIVNKSFLYSIGKSKIAGGQKQWLGSNLIANWPFINSIRDPDILNVYFAVINNELFKAIRKF